MTQNTKQSVRTLDEHAFALAQAMQDDQSLSPTIVKFARKELVEAEARGAAEQRRKDAEGQSNVSSGETRAIYQIQHQNCVWHEYSPTEWNSADYPASRKRILYTHPANVAALEARIAELVEAEQLARADAEASKANTGWKFLTENVSSDPELPSCRLNRMFQEGDSSERIEETLAAFGIEARWDATEWDWQAPPEEMEELSADDLGKCDPRKDLTDAGWKLVDAWDTEDSEIVRMYARPTSAAFKREGAPS